ncbi:maestro heat-like repeat-containing protein family member 2B [Alligator mississippiensis]|uniref:maestro heat-like repeat-containing protein family member 2B n=1 Tax=Alligator mississippiensis TaxID=8496 RepID=UPI0028778FBD|nr:maestro heat-like repeat-containing protein family member 2B [Alligator mississippiensis]
MKESDPLAVLAASAQNAGLEISPLFAVLGNLSFVARPQGLAPAELLVGGDERDQWKSKESFSSISGFSTSDASAGRCLVDQAQGNLGPGFGQADMDLDITVSLLLERLQQEEEMRVTIYSSLQEVLQGDIKSLDRSLVRRIVYLASKDMRETQQENDEVQLAAGKTLVALAGTFYNWVMYELQYHVGIMELPPIYFLIALGNVASAYALRSEPFLVLTLSKLRFVLRLVETDQMKWALCGVVEGFARAANLKFHIGDESPFPSCRAADYGFHVLPFLSFMSSSWLTSKDLEVRTAVFLAA